MAEFISGSPEETLSFGQKYAQSLKAGDVVILNGEMGAGKTVFCKGVALGLGIQDEVLSPTYAYMNDYYGKLYHFDCYRLKNGAQAEALGLCDYFYADGVCLIEWAENIADVLPSNCKTVTVEKCEGGKRKIIYE
ncbi:MAG: tRNA (adenosine(37)-N6)-threonylcarbamoyltransferase complex ATPase subunit type 1 TsaE [Clostridia bacterium]|nr:tRNA (adenosine(37)-N6)-threonylcarbamoyltransferase complex ATPase subunit type 1 TsaE [Clostridia bacterium]